MKIYIDENGNAYFDSRMDMPKKQENFIYILSPEMKKLPPGTYKVSPVLNKKTKKITLHLVKN